MKKSEQVEMHRLRLDDGTSWPRVGHAAALDHLLRYGEPSKSDLLAAASVISAYVHIATHPMGTEKSLQTSPLAPAPSGNRGVSCL